MVAHIIARSIGRRIGKKLLEEQQAVDFWRRELTFSQQEELDRRLKEEGKSVLVAYLCFCTLQCHYAYLGRWWLQTAYYVTFGGLIMWFLVDLFTFWTQVCSYNNQLALERIIPEIISEATDHVPHEPQSEDTSSEGLRC